jgi:predicted ferric reductase
MGLMMFELYKKYNFLIQPLLYIVLISMVANDLFERTLLKDSLSFVTLSALFLLIGQMFLNKLNRKNISIHKWLGYIFIPILVVHPFFIVLPRFFESGADPIESFFVMITAFHSQGIVVGLIAWVLMLVLGLTSLFKDKLGIKHKTWKIFHGILSIEFLLFALWHAMDIGRHIDISISIVMGIVTTIASFVLLNKYSYTFTTNKKQEDYYGK